MGDRGKWGLEQEVMCRDEQEFPRARQELPEKQEAIFVEEEQLNDVEYGGEPDSEMVQRFKFSEDKYMAEVLAYIASTYGEHYVGEDKERTQVVDLWESLGSLGTTSRDTAIKYLSRYGRKGGHNKKDLMKAIHYTVLLWYATEDKQ